ncbi:MAG: 16S rRNA (cytosine(1402)-N(4))-methyltransferase RsmH [Endomicrobiales bacterium]|nr:16S rRNA (cytosine(1402)-N(4))-methyltransferase RsmH [Endomicrobiales bacterium]
MYHLPVMAETVEKYLVTDPAGLYLDCTLGGGGHSERLLRQYPGLRVIGIDRDEEALEFARERLKAYGARLSILKENFSMSSEVVRRAGSEKVNGMIADLGVSSHQLEEKTRGFGFDSETLDMRMDPASGKSAGDVINEYPEEKLADIFFKYGEERHSRKISRAIAAERKLSRIDSAKHLSRVVYAAVGKREKIHPATRVFQALRIFVNDELGNLERLMAGLSGLLLPGSRAVIISYHSLEDRIVKNAFRDMAGSGSLTVLTKKVVFPEDSEIRNNPRARSAKLRAAERV